VKAGTRFTDPGGMEDAFYRSKDPTNSIKVLKEATKNKENAHTKRYTQNKHSKSPSLQ